MRSALDLDLGSAPSGARLRKGITVGALVGCIVGVPLLGVLLIAGPEFVGRHGATLRLDLAAVLQALGAMLGASVFAVGYPVVQHRRPARVLLALLAVLPWLAAFTIAFDRGYDRWTRSHHTAHRHQRSRVRGPARLECGDWLPRETASPRPWSACDMT